jgi:hypothetical protein
MQIGFRRFRTRKKMVSMDINGVTAGTTYWGGKKRDTEFALEANEPKSGRGTVGSEA